MPKKHRLSGAQIRSIRSPRRLHGALFSVSISTAMGTVAQCACVVSKKIATKAVKRNLIKRRCRASLAPHLAALPAATYLFQAKKDSARASYAEIHSDIELIVQQLRGAPKS